MVKAKTSIICKTSDRRTKWIEILDSQVAVQHIWGTFGLVPFNVILRSFGALSSFRNLGLMIREIAEKKKFQLAITAKFQNATPPTIFIRCQPNFTINKLVVGK